MAKNPWKSWHEVVTLRDDLKSGELPLHMFAADLYEVMMQGGKRPIYEDPINFFALTFPTYNLRQLVRDVVLRVAGKNDKAVRQLELTYGGGKTHTLITLRHLVFEPDKLPDLPAVHEFREAIGQPPPKARVAGLCFDKLDVETGMEVRDPQGNTRRLIHPWSILAWQIAGEEGLRVLNAGKSADERESAPAENTLTELLELPVKAGLGVLILIDEVLMYVREKVSADRKWRDRMVNFFQYLTQAATKVDRCCIVASLLASDPGKDDSLGRQLKGELYDIFQRQREEAVEPVVKEDVAEVLRRRFFTPKSIKDKDAFRPHVQAALKGVFEIDEQTKKQGGNAEERFLKSYPFHPDLTEVFYVKWTGLDRFQRTRGVLRTFALALREAERWDTSPLVGPAVFLADPKRDGLSEAMRELVTVADTEEHEGRRQAWTGIIEGETGRARDIQRESVGLRYREIEQAVVATFLHSQPIGQSARTRDLVALIAPGRPDRIELEKGLLRWSQTSFWLDDRYAEAEENQVPDTWRLGNRPNLTQMHAVAESRVSDEIVRARLLDEIGKCKSLTAGASAAGVRVHLLPTRPRDIEDDGQFHYGVLGPSAASDSGKPSTEAKRYLDETTSAEKPRVYRNAVILLAPSRDGLEVASARVRDYMAWEEVRADLKDQEKEGNVDVARLQTLSINIDKARGRIPDAVKQAYCTVVTVSDKNEVQAFKINVSDEPHFTIIKNDNRSRIQDSSVAAEALLPDGPYNLWREGETSRRVKDLSGAFAQMPHLPKMLKAQGITDTLVEGCQSGAFVLKLTRPDGSARTWWHARPDEAAMADPALELVLAEAAELVEIPPDLLEPDRLARLWSSETIKVQSLADYFQGGNVIQIQRNGYMEPLAIPKADPTVVNDAVTKAVAAGKLWLTNGPASVLGEPIPTGVLTVQAALHRPPAMIAAAEILPENLPDAWTNGETTALAIATALSQKSGLTLPWKTVRDVVAASLNARFTQLDPTSGAWPCDYPSAQSVKLKVAATGGKAGGYSGGEVRESNAKWAESELEPSQMQDLGDVIPQLLAIKSKSGCPIKFKVRIEVGDADSAPGDATIAEINQLLGDLKSGFTVS
ncbi:MAG: ATP-binding protein [Oligosphaeraceae bacterium]|nr:ATP-binding protein [Oligosphaeraceae bacterium]